MYSKLGQQEQAKAELLKALDIFPHMTLDFIHRELDCIDESFIDDYLATLKNLGLPDS